MIDSVIGWRSALSSPGTTAGYRGIWAEPDTHWPSGGPIQYRFRYADFLACALTLAQRRFVASTIARRPAALSLRVFRVGSGATFDVGPDCFLDAAHLFRCAAAILARAARDILRLRLAGGAGAAGSMRLLLSTWRRATI